MTPLYLDHAATTPVDPHVRAAMQPYFETAFANPSSVYAAARTTRQALEQARAVIADELGAKTTEIIFTSGTTESDNMAVAGVLRAARRASLQRPDASRPVHWVTSAIEHDAVLAQVDALSAEGCLATVVPVAPDGIVAAGALLAAVTDDTVLVSLMLANNEIGTLQPVAAVAGGLARIRADRAARGLSRPLYLHTDAAQAPNFLPLKVERLGVDLMSFGGSKLYGPRGTGVLYLRTGTALAPLIVGGGQERGRRSGTENVAGAVGLAAAVRRAAALRDSEAPRLTALRDDLYAGLAAAVPGLSLNGSRDHRLPGNLNLTIAGVNGEDLVLYLDQAGIMASTGSACASGSLDPSHVLMALGRTRDEAESSLRLSLGRTTDAAAVARVIEVLPPLVARLRERAGWRPAA